MVGGSDRGHATKLFRVLWFTCHGHEYALGLSRVRKLPTPGRPLLKRCTAIHLTRAAAKDGFYNLAWYLESRAKEEETREYSIVDFKNADAAVDTFSFVKNNAV
ncbi:hypothetical protein CEXT_601511 [Caerostris extrusa]|uniref:Uncharacterized protein n=1 Tax=Caerostris extrusa TaxID=172846 RepID=A0AAV4SQU7_CAEEX|nr:hypothetical protein CEXT_601511 [Caerostris extrusa]